MKKIPERIFVEKKKTEFEVKFAHLLKMLGSRKEDAEEIRSSKKDK